MSQRKTLCKLTWLTFMPLLFVSSYFVMLLNFSCDGFKYYVFTLEGTGFAPIFPDTCYHLTHYWLAAVDIPVASDNPVH
ncbi:hypothetical protein ACRW7F_13865, partial [Escherichia coli]